VRSPACAEAASAARRTWPPSRSRRLSPGASAGAAGRSWRTGWRSLHPFVTASIAPGTRVITDGRQGYAGLAKLGYVRERRSQRAARARGEDPGKLLPAVHRVAFLAKRWLLGTHQGSVDDAHLAAYLNEFVFRFHLRRSASRGLLFHRVLELAVAHDPVRYWSLVASPKPKARPPVQPGQRGQPPSMDRMPAARAWRAADLH
jgi:hypothetical protein